MLTAAPGGDAGLRNVLATTETVPAEGAVEIFVEDDLNRTRRAVRAAAQRAGLRLVELTMLVTAASELARNCYSHAGGGTVTIEQVTRENPVRTGVRLTFTDHGPGIGNPNDVLFSGSAAAGGGLGHGLWAASRLADEFEVTTSTRRPSGTQIIITKWKR